MALLSLTQAHLAFGHVPLLDGADLSLDNGERIGLIGRNGAGKSSLLKILAGLEKPDDGLLQVQGGVRREYVPQEPFLQPGASLRLVYPEQTANRHVGHRPTIRPTANQDHRVRSHPRT